MSDTVQSEAEREEEEIISINKRTYPFIFHCNGNNLNRNNLVRDIERKLNSILSSYQKNVKTLIETYQREHYIAQETELIYKIFSNQYYSNAIASKLEKVIEAYETNEAVLKQLLKPFPYVFSTKLNENGIVSFSATNTPLEISHVSEKSKDSSKKWILQRGIKNSQFNKDEDILKQHDYESGMQIITHLVRDWSNAGQNIQTSLYSWCIEKFQLHLYSNQPSHLKEAKILIPGAGLGRLAFEFYKSFPNNIIVEANDSSIPMAAAAYRIFHGNIQDTKIFPYFFDFLWNEIFSHQRFDSVSIHLQDKVLHRPSSFIPSTSSQLSYRIGEFTSIYSSKSMQATFDAIVTSFFIDTAVNIYDYILIMAYILKPPSPSQQKEGGGLWINVGPLQWHKEAILHPTVDELKEMLSNFFDILEWNVDSSQEQIIYYRSDLDKERFTKVEFYRPLRFVVKRKSDTYIDYKEFDLHYCMERLRYRLSVDAINGGENDYDLKESTY